MLMIKRFNLLLLFLFIFVFEISAQVRTVMLLEKDWKFLSGEDNSEYARPSFDDSNWQTVSVPHDWAIYGPFDRDNDVQKLAIVQDGQTKALEHTGRTGGLPFIGVGWYRNSFQLLHFQKGKKVFVLFDGAMSHAEVYINGRKVGSWPYGYNSFWFDITSYVNEGGNNCIAVRLENFPESSRWYPGAGLYRNVHILVTDDIYVPIWGTYVTTPVVNKDYAKVSIQTKVILPDGTDTSKYMLKTIICNDKGEVLKEQAKTLKNIHYDDYTLTQDFIVEHPNLWSTDTPYIYQAVTYIYDANNRIKDKYVTHFGIRSIKIIPDKGFYLNGERVIFKGVCLHHDLGPIGAAVNDAAIRRQIRILKDMGCNAIRTAHNMPAPELIKACDEMGMMVVAESFDEWSDAKMPNGYHTLFDEWAEKDLVNLIHHYRNSPSIMMWSIGNEVPSQGCADGSKVAKFLQDICHREDPTRPVTQGMDMGSYVVGNNFAAVMDIPGFNYRSYLYQDHYKKLPQQVILGTETASTVSSRGVYKFPVERKSMATYDDHQASSYDVETCSWGDLPEDEFIQYDDLPYCMGEFVWAGFDYLGEPSPYYSNWPSHSSLFGIIDLAGIPKDRFYLYRSHWNKKAETLHILPHWNWEGCEGQNIPVFVYTNYPSAELFINGKSQGRKFKLSELDINSTYTDQAKKDLIRQKRYRLMWMDTKYEPGIIKVVAYDEHGNRVASKELRTAGKPDRIVLIPDRDRIKADGKDLSFINVRVVDKDGNFCPRETRMIKFKVKGCGKYKAAANGDPTSLELFHQPQMKLFSGQLTAIVQSTPMTGDIVFEASAPGVKSARVVLKTY